MAWKRSLVTLLLVLMCGLPRAWGHVREVGVTEAEREVLTKRIARLKQQALADESRLDFPAAQRALAEVLTVVATLNGSESWQATDARLALDDLKRRAGWNVAKKKRWVEAEARAMVADERAKAGRYREAVELYSKVNTALTALLGTYHASTATNLSNLAEQYIGLGEYGKAKTLLQRSIAIALKVLGEAHPITADIYDNLAELYLASGDHGEAESLLARSLAIRLTLLGEEHPATAESLNNLAVWYRRTGNSEKAEPLHQRSFAIYLKVLGEQHPHTAASLNNLGELYRSTGQYGKAEPLLKRSLDIRLRVLGEEHPDTAESLNNLAWFYFDLGEYRKAEPLYQQSLAIRLKLLGEDHPSTAYSFNNLGLVYKRLGLYDKAESLLQRSLALDQKRLGTENSGMALISQNLAGLYLAMGEYKKAELLFQRSLDIGLRILGADHPDIATSLDGLAVLYASKGEVTKAGPLLERSLAIRRKVFGNEHPRTAVCYANLVMLYLAGGGSFRAEPIYRRKPSTNLDILGADHPHGAINYPNTAGLNLAMSGLPKILRYAAIALDGSLHQMQKTFPILTEPQKLRYQRVLLHNRDLWLSLTSDPHTSTSFLDSWRALFGWKGQIQRYESFFQRAAHDPAHQLLHTALVETTARLATAQTLLQKASDEQRPVARERYDQALSAQEAAAQALFAAMGPMVPPRQDARSLRLPVGSALVDVQYYNRLAPVPSQPGGLRTTPSYVVFVLRPDRPVVRIELGPANAIDGPLFTWRKHMYGDCESCLDDAATLELRLRARVWEPLESALEGVSTVFISPDGALNVLPFSALPGNTPGSRLLEELNIVLVPSPQMLLELLADVKALKSNTTTDIVPRDGLLLVGDVDYDDEPGVPVADKLSRSGFRGLEPGIWRRLPQTAIEIDVVARQFRTLRGTSPVQILKGEAASEEAIGSALSHAKQAHFATHGFYKAPPPDSKGMQGAPFLSMPDTDQPTGPAIPPGLRVGLVLAGANRTPEPGQDDGILTALELTSLDLRGLELITLSACETGLGDGFGGEGMVSLQRALHAAGAKRVVSSLWPVEDEATRLLMTRFYDNLWQKHLPAHAALREAQRWMLRESGFGQKTGEKAPVSPRYWAAFELSGDWR